MPFRSLLPAPDGPGHQQDHDDPSQQGNPAPRPLLKRIRSVPQACQMCRQMKAKCDGGRPRCGNCIDRDRPCGYEGEAGQSRQAAMRSRLAAYETLFSSLRAAPPTDTEELLQRVRLYDDPVAIVREAGSLVQGSGRMGRGVSGTTATTSVSAAALAAATSASSMSASAVGNISDANSSDQEGSISPVASSSRIYGRASSSTAGGSSTSYTTFPSASTLSLSPPTHHPTIELTLPSAAVTSKAVAAFYHHTGQLFQVFTQDEASRYYEMLFGVAGGGEGRLDPGIAASLSPSSINMATACLASVAAVGMQSAPDAFDPQAALTAYDLARHHFELVAETAPFTAIKLAAMLAMFNATVRHSVASTWIDHGLKLCRTHGLIHEKPIDPIISADEWAKNRQSWRTLVFLSCWLSFTIGSVSGQAVELEKMNQPTAMEIDDDDDCSHSNKPYNFRYDASISDMTADFEQAIQSAFSRLSDLAVKILRVHITFKEMTMLFFSSVLRDLEMWHDRLPLPLHLANLCDERKPKGSFGLLSSFHRHQFTLVPETRRSAYHLHLLHQSSVLLIYRRMVAQFSQLSSSSSNHFTQSANPFGHPHHYKHRAQLVQDIYSNGNAKYHALDSCPSDSLLRQGIEAARTSADVFSQLASLDGQAPRRCWIVIIVLLHIVAQRQMHGCPASTWQNDLQRARLCLEEGLLTRSTSSTSSSCSSYSVDGTAREFYSKLAPLLAELEVQGERLKMAERTKRAKKEARAAKFKANICTDESEPTSRLLLTVPVPTDADKTRLAVELTSLLGRPFHHLWPITSRGMMDDAVFGRLAHMPDRVGLPQLSTLDLTMC